MRIEQAGRVYTVCCVGVEGLAKRWIVIVALALLVLLLLLIAG